MAHAHHFVTRSNTAEHPSLFPTTTADVARLGSSTELAHVEAIEVTLAWGDCVLGTVYHHPPRTVTFGESQCGGRPCDFLVPCERLGFDSLPIVEVIAGEVFVLLPAAAEGFRADVRGARLSLERLRMDTPQHELLARVHRYSLRHLEQVFLRIGVFSVTVRAVAREAKAERTGINGLDRGFLSSLGATFIAVSAWLGTLAFYVPSLALTEDEGINDDQVRTIQQYLTANAERNRVIEEVPNEPTPTGGERGGHAGQRSPGDEGKMGSTVSKRTSGRFGIRGPVNNPDPHLGRAEMLEMARSFGMVELLGNLNASAQNGMASPWGRDVASGRDDVDAIGQLYGESIGDSAGFGGLALSGTGQGGGCRGAGCGAGIGVGEIGTIGGGRGSCDPSRGPCDGMGAGNGLGNGPGHRTRAPRLRPDGVTSVSGRLPPEVIQRIVRQNYGRFRFCYEQGLTRNPNLEGRVATRFVIGRDGAVSNAQNGGSDLPDPGVVGCIVQSFYGLSFPAPEGGIVTVTYPISLQPG